MESCSLIHKVWYIETELKIIKCKTFGSICSMKLTWISCGLLLSSHASAIGFHPRTSLSMYTIPWKIEQYYTNMKCINFPCSSICSTIFFFILQDLIKTAYYEQLFDYPLICLKISVTNDILKFSHISARSLGADAVCLIQTHKNWATKSRLLVSH